MQITYDKEADAAYIDFKKGKIRKTIELKEDFQLDIDEKGEKIGLEILNVSYKASADLFQMISMVSMANA